MRADERQAAVAYAYAWWMTGDDEAAATALRVAMNAPEPPEDGDEARLVALVRAVRAHLGGLRAMPAASELALLHDGFEIPLRDAAVLAAVPAAQAEDHLAHGRLEALLETVREDFRHPERLGGLAVGNDSDLQHAQECRSCSRARTLFERGARELRDVSAVSAPAGLIPALVAEHAPVPEAEPEAPAEQAAEATAPPADEAADAGPEAPEAGDDTVAVHDVLDAPRDYTVAGDDVLDEPRPAAETPSVEELEAMLLQEAPEAPPAPDSPADIDTIEPPPAADSAADIDTVEAPPDADVDTIDEPDTIDAREIDAPEAPPDADAPPDVGTPEAPADAEPAALAPDRVPTTPVRRRAAAVLAVAGILTLCALVVVWTAAGGPEDVPGTSQDVDRPAGGADQESEAAADQPTEETTFGPQQPPNNGFSVTSVGLLLSGSQEPAPSGTTIAADEPMRIAVDYVNGSKGVNLDAVWRVEGEPYQRLHAVVSSRASRHVWGIPVPPRGWPPGDHRVVVTANDSVAGAIDFTVEAGE